MTPEHPAVPEGRKQIHTLTSVKTLIIENLVMELSLDEQLNVQFATFDWTLMLNRKYLRLKVTILATADICNFYKRNISTF